MSRKEIRKKDYYKCYKLRFSIPSLIKDIRKFAVKILIV